MIVIVVIAIISIFSQSLISADKGKWIRKIIIVKEKSFSNSLSFLNDLKFSTRDAVIFNDITFKAGDSLDLYKLYESERILREREFLANVKIDLSPVGDDSVDVIISFADKWSTYVNFSYRRQGDYRNYGLTFKDLNLFGFGYNVSLSLAFLNFGKSREFIFFDKNLFGTRYEFKFQGKLYPEWGIKTIHLHRRFYSLESGHELSLYYQDFSGQKYIFQGESYKGMFLKK
jgi:outer membrane protein assembly factor BamA